MSGSVSADLRRLRARRL